MNQYNYTPSQFGFAWMRGYVSRARKHSVSRGDGRLDRGTVRALSNSAFLRTARSWKERK